MRTRGAWAQHEVATYPQLDRSLHGSAELRAAMVTQKKDYWVEQADIQTGAISAWIARAEGRNDDALNLMRETADREDKTEEHIMMPGRVIPVREMLGELLLDLDQPAMALAAFEQSQKVDPNRFRNVCGAARAAARAGQHETARTSLRAAARTSGPERRAPPRDRGGKGLRSRALIRLLTNAQPGATGVWHRSRHCSPSTPGRAFVPAK